MAREVMWISPDGQKFEHLSMTTDENGHLADGVMIHLNPEKTYRLRYRIHCDSLWQVRSAEINRLDKTEQSVVLLADGAGRWMNGRGVALRHLHGCCDLDIYFSPFTNTLAIRRLGLAPGESADIEVVYIDAYEMSVKVVQQRYTFMRVTAEGALYRYENLPAGGFTAELPVDADGLLLEYPGFFKRAWAR